MKAEQARKLADEALDNLSAALAAGKSETLRQYLSTMSRFHDYSWGNVLLILTQKPDSTRVAGFHAWRKLGRFVRKGEKGIVIIAPMVIQKRDENATQPESDSKPERLLRFKAVYVFDLSQTDGEPLPEFRSIEGDPAEHALRLKELIAAQGITLDYADDLGGALGKSFGGRIEILAGQSPAEEFAVLAHELAHEMLHDKQRRQETTKTVRETEAEAVAFVVCEAIGLTTRSAAADYIQLYDGNADTLAESLDLIQKASAEIIEHLLQTDVVAA